MTTTAITREAAGALRDLKVLDFGHYIAGPLLGMLLSDQGDGPCDVRVIECALESVALRAAE